MTDSAEFDFSGSQGAEVAKESNKGGNFAREVEYFGLDGSPAGVAQGTNQGLFRFVTDSVRRTDGPMSKYNLAWITVAGHYAQTKPKPEWAKEGANWPTKMSAGCRKDKVFTGKFGGQCLVCEQGNKSSNRTWALAVEREEVRENGSLLGYRDKTREVNATDEKGDFIVLSTDGDKKTYQMKTVPAFVVMHMGWKNFFGPLSASAAYYDRDNVSGLLSGDWVITRTGTTNNDTNYTFIRVSEQALPEGNPYGLPGGTKYDLAIPGLMEQIYPDMPDLRRLIADKVSDDYFGRFFQPGWTPPDHEAKGPQQQVGGAPMMMMTPSQPPATPATPAAEEPSSSALEALRNRVTQSAGTPAQ